MTSAGDPGTTEFEDLQSKETPNVDITKLFSNAAIIAALVSIIGGSYFFITGKKLSADQIQALTQVIPSVGLILVAYSVQRAKAAAYRSSGKIASKQEKVTQLLSDHLRKVGEGEAAAEVDKAMQR